jgi:hypothetical protein
MAFSNCGVNLRLIIDFLEKVTNRGRWYSNAPKLEKRSTAFLDAQEILAVRQDGFQGKSQNPPTKGDGRILEDLLEKLYKLAGYPFTPTPKWVKTEVRGRANTLKTPTVSEGKTIPYYDASDAMSMPSLLSLLYRHHSRLRVLLRTCILMPLIRDAI